MDFGYAVIGKYKGKEWKSKIFLDAEQMSRKLSDCSNNKDYSDLKECNVYIHYEEIKYEY